MKTNKFKKGDYIVITECNSGTFNGKLNHCYKLIDDDYRFKHMSRIPLDTPAKKARYATLEEIDEYDRLGKPYDVTTLVKEGILIDESPKIEDLVEEAKRRYPVGCKAKCFVANDFYEITEDVVFEATPNGIVYSYIKGKIYHNHRSDGNWAEVELTEPISEKWKPKVGDWVVILPCPSKVNWIPEMDEFVGKCVQLKKNKDNYFKIDKDAGKWNWEYTGRVKHFRKAEPHEIPKTEEPKTKPMNGYTAEEALAELKKMGFKEGVKYVYMDEDGNYSEGNIFTASRDPGIRNCGNYIDCGNGYLWTEENPTNLHRGPITKLDVGPAKLAILEEVPSIPEHQLKTINHAFQPRINQDYSKPETLLTKTTLNY